MKTGDRDNALDLAAAISDGRRIDWSTEERRDPSASLAVRRMRLVDEIAAAHRALHAGPATAADLDATLTTDVARNEAGAPTADERGAIAPAPASWGPLLILDRLGRGGFGEVFRAYDPTLQREVALKLLRPEVFERSGTVGDRLIEEARRMARVRHENILAIHGADRHDGRAGFWMDLLRGRTLEDLLRDQGSMGSLEAVHVGLSVCRALAAVHRAGLVHRDVKTTNIMREEGGRIVLMDFGSGVDVSGPRAAHEAPTGTPLFMAPELLRGEPASATSDLYALGVVLYRLVTGRFPIEAGTLFDLMSLHESGAAVPLRERRADLPTNFVQVVERAIVADPKKRFAGAGAMETALASAVDAVPVGVVPVGALSAGPEPAAPMRPRRWRRLLGAGLAAAAVAAGAAFTAWRVLQPVPITVDAALYRVSDGADARLRDGGRIHPGDHLYLEMDTTMPVHAYVLNSDETGNAFVLFPVPGVGLANPLPAGRHLRLPGRGADGKARSWEVTSAGGREAFLVIVSRHALEALERDLGDFQRVQEGREIRYAPVGDASRRMLRGVGGLWAPDTAPGGAASDPLTAIASRMGGTSDARRDLWLWRIELENTPAP